MTRYFSMLKTTFISLCPYNTMDHWWSFSRPLGGVRLSWSSRRGSRGRPCRSRSPRRSSSRLLMLHLGVRGAPLGNCGKVHDGAFRSFSGCHKCGRKDDVVRDCRQQATVPNTRIFLSVRPGWSYEGQLSLACC